MRAAPARFDETLTELERRGLLQYERGLKRYDLHPVVRGVAAGRMGDSETGEIGSQVVDYFSSRPHDPFEQAESLEDVAPGMQLVATLTRIGDFDRALSTLQGELSDALFSSLLADAGYALRMSDPVTSQHLLARALRLDVSKGMVSETRDRLINLAIVLHEMGKLAEFARLRALALGVAEASGDDGQIFLAVLRAYYMEASRGAFDCADGHWARLDPMRRNWSRASHLVGEAETMRAYDLFWRGALTETVLAEAERLCREGFNRQGVCDCLSLRGQWRLSRDEPDLAIEPLNEALRLYRAVGHEDTETEALLVVARLRAGHRVDARVVAERMDSKSDHEAALAVAELWRELGEPERARAAALRAHKSACGSGEPYVYRYHLDRAKALLCELGETPPEVPQHDPANEEVFDWEDDVRALIEKTRKEREDRERKRAPKKKKTDE